MAAGAPFADARDRHVTGLPERDRRLAHALAAGVLRHRAALDQLFDLRRTDRRLHDILRLGAFQLRQLARVPAYAAVSTSVTLAREAAGDGAARFVNAELRRLAIDDARRTAVASHPDWLLARWRARFGASETEPLAAWNDRQPSLTLQPARWTLAELGEQLRRGGWLVSNAPFGVGLRVLDARARAPRPTTLPGFATGAFIVQDAAAALVCYFAAPRAGATVYDACAAPGGKAVTLARAGVRLIAGDSDRERLGRLVETLRRCGARVPVVAADLRHAPFEAAALDMVFVDAPCTATGVIARHPDARWRVTERAIQRAAIRQAALLDAAADLVRPGGVLVYATCSLEPEENAHVVNGLLVRRADFRRAPVRDAVPAELVSADGDLEILPQRHGMDGAFAARLERAA